MSVASPLFDRFLRWAGLVAEAPVLALPGVVQRVQGGYEPAEPRSTAPILPLLQKRAAWELFDWLGLDMVPIAYWRILAETKDPADALSRLIVRNGLDPLKVRRRDARELEAFRAIVRSICQHETILRSISEHEPSPGPIADHHIADDLRLREVVGTLDEVLKLFTASCATSRVRRFILLVARVDGLRQRPDSVTIEEANAALEEARGLAAASWRHAAAAERYRAAIVELDLGWADWAPTVADNAVCQRLVQAATSAERLLFDDADCDIEEQLSVYDAAVDTLQSLIHRLRERALKAAEEERARQEELPRLGKEPSQMSLDELLVFFSFEPGSRPTSSQLKSAFLVMAQRTQPRPGDANFVAKNLRYRQAIDAFKTLKAAMTD
jgi:hypothetical protein